MDIATLLETHKVHFTELANKLVADGSVTELDLNWAHDRATTKTLLDLHRNSKPLGQDALTTPPPQPVDNRVKAGSRQAKKRAAKAQITRAANRERAKAGTGSFVTAPLVDDPAEPKLSSATHLTPITGGGTA